MGDLLVGLNEALKLQILCFRLNGVFFLGNLLVLGVIGDIVFAVELIVKK